MKKIIFFFVLLSIIPVTVLSLLGSVPALSQAMGANDPVDLGIYPTAQDLTNADDKIYIKRIQIDPSLRKEYFYSDEVHKIKENLTSEELTVWLNDRTWKHYPFTNLQVKLGTNGQAEISGNVDIKKLIGYFETIGGLTQDEISQIKSHIPLTGNPAFYLDLIGNINQNQVSLTINKAKLGALTIPQSIVAPNTVRLVEFIQDKVLIEPSISFDTLTPQDGTLKVVGTLPDTEYVK